MKERKDDKLWCNKRNQADSIPFHETRESGREQTTDTNDTRTLHTHTHTHTFAHNLGEASRTYGRQLQDGTDRDDGDDDDDSSGGILSRNTFLIILQKRKGNRNSLPLFERVIR